MQIWNFRICIFFALTQSNFKLIKLFLCCSFLRQRLTLLCSVKPRKLSRIRELCGYETLRTALGLFSRKATPDLYLRKEAQRHTKSDLVYRTREGRISVVKLRISLNKAIFTQRRRGPPNLN